MRPEFRAALLVVGLFAAASCKKKEESSSTSNNGQGTTVSVQGGQVSVREENGISRYSDEGPESGTVFTKHAVPVRKAADQTAESIITRIGPGTGVNKKARHGAFFLVDYPTGAPGEMKPGWVLQDEVTGTPTVATTTHTPPLVTVPPPATTGPVHIRRLPRVRSGAFSVDGRRGLPTSLSLFVTLEGLPTPPALHQVNGVVGRAPPPALQMGTGVAWRGRQPIQKERPGVSLCPAYFPPLPRPTG